MVIILDTESSMTILYFLLLISFNRIWVLDAFLDKYSTMIYENFNCITFEHGYNGQNLPVHLSVKRNICNDVFASLVVDRKETQSVLCS